MGNEQLGSDSELQRQVDELREQVTLNRADIDALGVRADEAGHRADALEARADLDRKLIAELQADGLVSAAHAEQLEEALRSSRKIGAAIGIIMANRRVTETGAFAILVSASQNTNCKLRLIAEEVVETGDVSRLPAM